MADAMTSLGQTWSKAREILDGMSEYRIDPTTIKTAADTLGIKGGQGVVIVGTLSSTAKAEKTSTVSAFTAEHGIDQEGRGLASGIKVDLRMGVSNLQRESEGHRSHSEEEDQIPEPKVAIKILEWNRGDLEQSTKFFKSFVHELKLMATISHPNVIKLVGFVEDMEKGDARIILPWQGNGNVREFLQSGEWDIPERISLIQDTAKGLEYLHSHEPPICHGDLKSLNILVNPSYHAIITDFGSARIRRSVASGERKSPSDLPCGAQAEDGVTAGWTSPEVKLNPSTLDLTLTGPKFSLRWTAPEVLREEEQDLPSDIWAMGWICWEMITGQIPFEGLNKQGAIIAHTIKGKLPAIRENVDTSQVLMLCGLMSECWLLEPTKRIDSLGFKRKVGLVPSSTPSGSVSGGQKTRSAHLLLEMGEIHALQYEHTKAVFYYQSALDVATRTKNELAQGNALQCLGSTFRAQLKNLEAEKVLMEAHEIHSRIGNDMGAANALDGLGEIYRAQSKYDEAEKTFTKAYEVHSRIRSDMGAANALGGLGELYRAQSKYLEAEKSLTKAHEIHSRIGNDTGTADALDGLGQIYRAQSKYGEAEKTFTKAYEIHSRIGGDVGAANALEGLGEIYRAQSKHGEAEKAFKTAYEMYSRIANDLGATNALLGLGNTYLEQSRSREAEKAFNEAYKIHASIEDYLGTGNIFRSQGMLYQDQCRFDEAELSYRQALTAYDRANDADSRARTLFALGKLHRAQDRYFDAEKDVAEALAIWISLADEGCQADACLLLADIFQSQSKPAPAMDALIPAKGKLARTGRDAIHADTLHRLGNIHMKQGMHAQAEEHYRHAQAIYSSMQDAHGEAGELLILGALYSRQSRYAEAEECFAQARVAYARAADKDGEVKALEQLMVTYLVQRKLIDAKLACMEACEIYANSGKPMSTCCAETYDILQQLEGSSLRSLLARPFKP